MFEVHTLSVNLEGFTDDLTTMHILRAPDGGAGGAITITDAWYVNGTAHNAGTAFSLRLLNYGTAGTSNQGTVSDEIGGTAAPFATNTPKRFTIVDGKLEAGEWLVIRKDEVNSSDPVRGVLTIQYVMGG